LEPVLKVKVCGITRLEDALFCAEEGADALGFIFVKESPRFIKYDQAEKIINQLSPFILKIGVFLDESRDNVIRIADSIGLSAVQLHGSEAPNYTEDFPIPVIKTFRIHNKFKYSELDNYTGCVPLLDTYSGVMHGGTGTAFNWKGIPEQLRKRIILAGGVSADNIKSIYSEISPAAVDLSSSLESAPGIKDIQKVKNFFNEVHKIRKGIC
jgi:phosphoribosylanthranilate isomerase